ncbi:367_t:CDS:2 [Diversispora eburnea]|uniref:367_t:CDS:1 n=1 Tax=Diversispora eburnea TaxID=1213867 RepID=A0A9N8VYQ5_9GLOM|nr:367_t:CDS:2 [Diversispora eburnea]
MEPNQTLSTKVIAGSYKFKPLVIGKSLNPHCFKNFNKSVLPVIYHTNSKAWMCADTFVDWLNYINNYFHTMNRKIMFFINNAGSYFNVKRLEKEDSDISSKGESEDEQESRQNNNNKRTIKNNSKRISKLFNIKLIYLLPNTTAHFFKAKYNKEFCKKLIQQFDSGIDHKKNKLNIKDAIDYIAEGWNNVTQNSIQNCWIKTGILSFQKQLQKMYYFFLRKNKTLTEKDLNKINQDAITTRKDHNINPFDDLNGQRRITDILNYIIPKYVEQGILIPNQPTLKLHISGDRKNVKRKVKHIIIK